jgi:hypothetical protein
MSAKAPTSVREHTSASTQFTQQRGFYRGVAWPTPHTVCLAAAEIEFWWSVVNESADAAPAQPPLADEAAWCYGSLCPVLAMCSMSRRRAVPVGNREAASSEAST